MTHQHQPAWEPTIYNNHGQPLLTTPEEEQQWWRDTLADGLPQHTLHDPLHTLINQLNHQWNLNPNDHTIQAITWIQIAEIARQTASEHLHQALQNHYPHTVWSRITNTTTLTTEQLKTTYPPTPQPPF